MISKIRQFLFSERKGVAAIEFALLAPAFFMLMIAIFEIAYYIYMSTSTQRAVEKTIYDLRTGQVFAAISEEDIDIEQWYASRLCGYVTLPDCSTNLSVRVERYDMNAQSIWNSEDAEELSAGGSETLMRVEAVFSLPSIIFTGMVFGENASEMTAGLTFMTEPY